MTEHELTPAQAKFRAACEDLSAHQIEDRPAVVAALVRAKALLADLDRSARGVDVRQVRIGVDHEITTALNALEAGATTGRPGKERRDALEDSKRAVLRIAPKSGTQRGAILAELANVSTMGFGGLTDYEMATLMDIQLSSIRPRRGELCDAGYVQASDRVREHGGEQWTVWECTEIGRVAGAALIRERRGSPEVPGEQLSL